MTSDLLAAIGLSTFITSFISGVFGMAGGMILKAVFLSTLTIEASMVLHALIQLVANGWRCFIWRHHIVWRVLPFYFVGVVIGLTLVSLWSYVPSTSTAFIVMGCVPLLSMIAGRLYTISILHKGQTIVAAIFLTFVQMTAGVIGPLLDLLYNQSSLTRQQIVSTKAFSQTVMHALRIAYYSAFIPLVRGAEAETWPDGLDGGAVALLLILSICGTSLAAPVVQRMGDKNFKTISRVLVVLISVYCLYQGISLRFVNL